MPEYELIEVNGLQLVSIKWNATAWFYKLENLTTINIVKRFEIAYI